MRQRLSTGWQQNDVIIFGRAAASPEATEADPQPRMEVCAMVPAWMLVLAAAAAAVAAIALALADDPDERLD